MKKQTLYIAPKSKIDSRAHYDTGLIQFSNTPRDGLKASCRHVDRVQTSISRGDEPAHRIRTVDGGGRSVQINQPSTVASTVNLVDRRRFSLSR